MKMRILPLLLAAALLLTCFAGCAKKDDDIQGDIKPQDTDEQVSMGSNKDGKYENKFIGIGCKLGEDWTFMSDEEIRKLNNIASDMLGEEYQKLLEKATVIYDMMATHSNGTDTVGVVMEKLSGASNLLSEKAYVEASVDKLKGALESMGVENVLAKDVEFSFAGKKHYGVQIEGEVSGLKCYETLVCVKCSGYMVCITACTWQEDGTGAIFDSFYGM